MQVNNHEGSLGRVLEVGCGAGFAAVYLEGLYNSYVGLDYSTELIEVAERLNHGPNRTFVAENAADHLAPEPYDALFAVGVLHYFDDPKADFAGLVRHVRPGGWIIVNEPHPGKKAVTAMRSVRKKLDANYSADQVELSSPELISIFENAALTDVFTTAQGFLSTPFAEVPLPSKVLTRHIAAMAARSLLKSTTSGCRPTDHALLATKHPCMPRLWPWLLSNGARRYMQPSTP
ncbi:MAG: class I SAM-dependent methyltransferase [Acidimicrobiales bacterium]